MMDNSYPSSKRKYDEYLRLNETEEFQRSEQNRRKVFLNGLLSEEIHEYKSALVRTVEKLFGEVENYIVQNSASNTYIIFIFKDVSSIDNICRHKYTYRQQSDVSGKHFITNKHYVGFLNKPVYLNLSFVAMREYELRNADNNHGDEFVNPGFMRKEPTPTRSNSSSSQERPSYEGFNPVQLEQIQTIVSNTFQLFMNDMYVDNISHIQRELTKRDSVETTVRNANNQFLKQMEEFQNDCNDRLRRMHKKIKYLVEKEPGELTRLD